MINQQLTYRYAKSLLDAAEEKGQLTQVENDLEQLFEWSKDNKLFTDVMKNPLIKPHIKIQLIHQLFPSAHPLILHFFELLIRNNRATIIPEIFSTIHQILLEKKKIVEVQVISAIPLDEQVRNIILQKIKEATGYTPLLIEKVNPDIIGGFIVKFKDYTYDASIRKNFTLLAREFSVNLYERKI